MKLCKLLTIITMTVFILFISFMGGINAQESHVGLGDDNTECIEDFDCSEEMGCWKGQCTPIVDIKYE
ncbi:hypothetical protein PV326_000790 [Microctonus aethiopoides]|nr:hypothetical protein PV326_000790 [Microctonus aethiopoides]